MRESPAARQRSVGPDLELPDHPRQSRIVLPDSTYGYVLRTVSADQLHPALRAVLMESRIVFDREAHQIQTCRARAYEALSDNEYAALIDMALGLDDKWIAKHKGMSIRTVQNRLLSLYDKLDVGDLDAISESLQINKRVRSLTRALNPARGERRKPRYRRARAAILAETDPVDLGTTRTGMPKTACSMINM